MKNTNMRNGSALSILLILIVIFAAFFMFISDNNPETVQKIKSGILSKSEKFANDIKDPIVLAQMKISDAENVYKNLVADVELKKAKLEKEKENLKRLKNSYITKLNNMKQNNVKLDKETYNNMLSEKELIKNKENYVNFLETAIKREHKLIKSLKTKLAQMYTEFNILKDKVSMAKAESGYGEITESDFNKMTNNVFNFSLKDLITEQNTKIIEAKSKNQANQTINEIRAKTKGEYNSVPNYQDLTIQ